MKTSPPPLLGFKGGHHLSGLCHPQVRPPRLRGLQAEWERRCWRETRDAAEAAAPDTKFELNNYESLFL